MASSSSSPSCASACFVGANGEALAPIRVKLEINKAKNLRDADHWGPNDHSDPYVIVTHKPSDRRSCEKVEGTLIGQTKEKKDNLNPVWNTTFPEFTAPLSTIIKFELFDKDHGFNDDYLGTAYLRLWEHVFHNDSAEEVWLQLHSTKESCKAQGSLQVTVTVSGLPDQVFEKVRLIGMPADADIEALLQKYRQEHGIAAVDPKLNLTGTEASAVEVHADGSSYVTVPLITNRLTRAADQHDGADAWEANQMVIGGSLSFGSKQDQPSEHHRPHASCSSSSSSTPTPTTTATTAAETSSSSGSSASPDNPWETPKKAPKESTYNWSNWGQTIFVKTRRQWHPKSLQGIQEAVADARAHNVKIRCVAHAHSWSPVFGDNGNDLMFLHALNKVTKNLSGPARRWTITAQAGATNGTLAAMLTKNSVYLPTNVISKEFLVGGVLSTGSHGSGWNDGLVLDSVVQLKIVDGHGELRTFNRYADEAWTVEDSDWKYVVLNLGLFGIVYEITYHVERQLQRALTKDWHVTLDRFWNTDLHERVITGEHYTELFWFPFNDDMWVKTWGFTDKHVKWRPFHTAWVTFSQWLQSKIGHYAGPAIAEPLADLTPLFCKSAMGLLKWEFMGPESKPKEDVLDVPDAIHWRKFLDAMSVWNCEVAVNLPTTSSGKVDVSAARELWMFVVNLTNDIASGKVKIPGLTNKYPNNVTLEARFIKNTSAFLSNAYGNQHTMFIEWVTNAWTPGWKEYSNYIMQECINRYPDSCRSHWAKYQQDMPDWIAYNRTVHGAHFDEFKHARERLDVDPNNTFTTSWLEAMFDLKKN